MDAFSPCQGASVIPGLLSLLPLSLPHLPKSCRGRSRAHLQTTTISRARPFLRKTPTGFPNYHRITKARSSNTRHHIAKNSKLFELTEHGGSYQEYLKLTLAISR